MNSSRRTPASHLLVVVVLLAFVSLGHVMAAAVPAMADMGHQALTGCTLPCDTVVASRIGGQSSGQGKHGDDAPSGVPSVQPTVLVTAVQTEAVTRLRPFRYPRKVPLHLWTEVLRN